MQTLKDVVHLPKYSTFREGELLGYDREPWLNLCPQLLKEEEPVYSTINKGAD